MLTSKRFTMVNGEPLLFRGEFQKLTSIESGRFIAPERCQNFVGGFGDRIRDGLQAKTTCYRLILHD